MDFIFVFLINRMGWRPAREAQCIRGSADEKDSQPALADERCEHEKKFICYSIEESVSRALCETMSET